MRKGCGGVGVGATGVPGGPHDPNFCTIGPFCTLSNFRVPKVYLDSTLLLYKNFCTIGIREGKKFRMGG